MKKSTSGKTKLTGEYDKSELEVKILFNDGKLSVIEKTKKRNGGNKESKYVFTRTR